MKRIATALITASLGAAVLHAQDEPQKPDADKKDKEQAEKEVYNFPKLDLGWSAFGLGGLNRKFLHYATPPDGLFISDFRYLTTSPGLDRFGFLTFRGVPEQDSVLQGLWQAGYGRTIFEGLMTRSNFYDDTPIVIDGSERKVQEALVKQKIGTLGMSVRYRVDQQDSIYEPPKADLHQRTRFWDVSGDGTYRGAQLGLGFSDTRFFDYTGVEPFSETERWNAHFARQITGNLALDGTFSQARVTQTGLAESVIESLNLAGDWDFGPTTFLVFRYRQDWLNLPVVQNASDRRRMAGSVQLVQNWDGWSTQVRYSHRDAERIRADHTYVDVPSWDTTELRASRKLAEGTRLTLKGSYEHMSGQPVMETSDPSALYWRNRSTAQVKVDRADDKSACYGSISFRNVQNDVRGFELDTTDYLLGGSYSINSYLEAFGEYSLEQNQTGGGPSDTPDYRSFFPSGRVITTGLSWSVRPSTWVSACFTDYTTANDNPLFLRDGNISGRLLTLSVRHRTASGNEYSLTFAPWRYDDSVASQMDYTSNVFMLTAAVRF